MLTSSTVWNNFIAKVSNASDTSDISLVALYVSLTWDRGFISHTEYVNNFKMDFYAVGV